jgi:hypothetical protein
VQVRGQLHAPAALRPGKNSSTHWIEAGWVQNRSWRWWKRSKSLDPAGIQISERPSAASCYTEYAIPAILLLLLLLLLLLIIIIIIIIIIRLNFNPERVRMCVYCVFRHHRLHQPVNPPLSSNVQKSGITGPGMDDGGEACKDREHPQTEYFPLTSFLFANCRTHLLQTLTPSLAIRWVTFVNSMEVWLNYAHSTVVFVGLMYVRVINVWTRADLLTIQHSADKERVQLLLTVHGRRCSDTTDGLSRRIVWGSWLRFRLGNYESTLTDHAL